MKLNKILLSVLVMMLVFTFAVFAGGDDEKKGKGKVDSSIDYDSLSMAELYEAAKKEGGSIKVYASTTAASSAIRRFTLAMLMARTKGSSW